MVGSKIGQFDIILFGHFEHHHDDFVDMLFFMPTKNISCDVPLGSLWKSSDISWAIVREYQSFGGCNFDVASVPMRSHFPVQTLRLSRPGEHVKLATHAIAIAT